MQNAALQWALARLREPSTWAGLAGLVASMTFLPHVQQDAAMVSVIGTAIASGLAIVLPEGAVK